MPCGDDHSRSVTKFLLYGFEILKICFKHSLLPPLMVLDDIVEGRTLRIGWVLYTAAMFSWFFIVYSYFTARITTTSPFLRIVILWMLVPILCVISETVIIAAIFTVLGH